VICIGREFWCGPRRIKFEFLGPKNTPSQPDSIQFDLIRGTSTCVHYIRRGRRNLFCMGSTWFSVATYTRVKIDCKTKSTEVCLPKWTVFIRVSTLIDTWRPSVRRIAHGRVCAGAMFAHAVNRSRRHSVEATRDLHITWNNKYVFIIYYRYTAENQTVRSRMRIIVTTKKQKNAVALVCARNYVTLWLI